MQRRQPAQPDPEAAPDGDPHGIRGPAPGRAPGASLDTLPTYRLARVSAVDPGAAGQPAERAAQLADLGFVPGEDVMVVARAWPGGDPMVVRVGASRFALRRAEAACVRVEPAA